MEILCILVTLALHFILLSFVSGFDPKLLQILNLMDGNEEFLVICSSSSLPLKSDWKDVEGLLTSSQFSFIKGLPTGNGNSSELFHPSPESDPMRAKLIAMLDTDEESTEFIINMAELNGKHRTYKDHWTLVLWPTSTSTGGQKEKLSLLSNKLKPSKFMTSYLVDSRIYIGFYDENLNASSAPTNIIDQFDFHEIYSLGEELIIRKVYQIGLEFWNKTDETGCDSEICRRLNLQGIHLRAQGVEDPEFQNDTEYKKIEGSENVILTDGFSVQVFRIAQQLLNFTYTASIMTPAGAKSLGEVSSWDGVVNRVQNGQADIGLSLTVQLPNRNERVHFISSTDDYIVSAFFFPSSVNAIRDIFMQPFEADLWAAVVSSWLVLAFSMVMFTAIRKRVGAMKSDEPDLAESSFIWALATACQQGWDEHPVAGSLRAIFISGSLTGVVAYAGYSAAIVSTLSLRSDPIKTPADLIGSQMTLGMRYGFLDNLLSRHDTDDVITRIYHRLSKNQGEARVNVSTGFSIMERKEYAFVCIRDTFYDAVSQVKDEKDVCNIRDLQILKRGFPAGPMLPKGSPYKEFFRLTITRIRERGVLWRLKVYYAYTRRCLASADNTGLALGLNDVFTAFMILLGGYALSASFLFLEKLLYVNKLTYIQ